MLEFGKLSRKNFNINCYHQKHSFSFKMHVKLFGGRISARTR